MHIFTDVCVTRQFLSWHTLIESHNIRTYVRSYLYSLRQWYFYLPVDNAVSTPSQTYSCSKAARSDCSSRYISSNLQQQKRNPNSVAYFITARRLHYETTYNQRTVRLHWKLGNIGRNVLHQIELLRLQNYNMGLSY